MGEHGEGDVAVPGVVTANLVVVEPDLGSRGLEAVLDGPAGAGDSDEGVVAGAGRCEAHVVGDLEFAFVVGCQSAFDAVRNGEMDVVYDLVR